MRSPRGSIAPPPRKPKAADGKLRMPWQMPNGPLAIEDADIFALQALQQGKANAGQQQRVLTLVIDKLCEESRMSFYPGGDDGRRASDFAEGKRWPASQIKRLLRMRPDHRDQSPPSGE